MDSSTKTPSPNPLEQLRNALTSQGIPPKPDNQATLEEKELFNDHSRKEERKQTIHYWFLIILRISAGAAIIVGLIRVYHMVAPDCWCWLDAVKIQTMDKVLFSGVLGGVLGKYIDNLIPEK